MQTVRKFLVRVLLAFVAVSILFLTSGVGSFLNRGRGGFIYFGGPRNESDPDYLAWYWLRHFLSTAYFALPTGLLVLLLGLHWRAALVVAVMTWLSLFVRWDSYVNIGMVDNLNRAGFLDWLIGRQGENWTVNQRFIREYAGLSVQGLIWTAPQGYLLEHLGFGWEYSLSGSLMGLVYYVGAQVNITSLKSTFLDCNVALSELFWGSYVWFVLSTVSLSQLVRRAHCTIHKRNPYLDYKPFSKWEVLKYESLNRTPFRVAYELFMLLLNLLYCCSLIFYELVEQREIQNKGQVFFGLFTAILCLTFTQGWSWSTRYLHWKLKRITKAIQRSNFNASQTTSSVSSPPPPGNSTQKTNLRGGQLTRERNKNEALQKAAARAKGFKDYGAMINESEPLLTWPYSHPDRLSPTNDRDTASGRNNRLQLPEGELEHETMTHNNIQRASASTAILVLWQNIEKWVWMDIFVWIRRLFGIISLLNVLLLIVMVVTATVQGWDSPRFMQQCGKA